MKALTVQQPWAWAIMYAGKSPESRTQLWRHRGPLAIHAGNRVSDRGLASPLSDHRGECDGHSGGNMGVVAVITWPRSPATVQGRVLDPDRYRIPLGPSPGIVA